MLFYPEPRKPRYARGVEWDRSMLALFVQAVMVNVARDEGIDKRVDRLTGAHAAPDFGGGDGDGGGVGEKDVCVRGVSGVGCRVSGENDEAREFVETIRIFPAIEVVQIIVADDPVEGRTFIVAMQLFERVDAVRDADAFQLDRRDVERVVIADGECGHRETVRS